MRWYRELSITAQIICKALAVLYLVLLAIGLVVNFFLYPFEKPLPFAVGLLAGTVLSVLKVVLLEKSLVKSMDMDGKIATNYSNVQMVARYFLTIIVLFLAAFFRNVIGLFGTVAGILALQPAAYIAAWRIRKLQLDKPSPSGE